MKRWLISVPVWGERCVDEFCAITLPALLRAVTELKVEHMVDARLVIHTDQPERLRDHIKCEVEFRPLPAGARGFDCMSQAHRDVLSLGLRGDIVVLLTAGAVISEQGLVYCADVLRNEQLLVILCAVPRVLAEGQFPDTADAQALMSWSWDHRHPMVDECRWPDGRSVDLSRTYFAAGDPGNESVVTRQLLPHPLAVRIDGRTVRFTPTADANLMQCYDSSEMHLAVNCARLAVVKLTPADKGYDLADATMAARAGSGQLVAGDRRQRWCMAHRIVLRAGPKDCADAEAEFVAAVKE